MPLNVGLDASIDNAGLETNTRSIGANTVVRKYIKQMTTHAMEVPNQYFFMNIKLQIKAV
jgi:hypothetical protein